MRSRSELPVLDSVRAEATTITATRRGHQFELQLGHLCNNRCVFCSSGQLSEWKIARPIAEPAIEAALDAARADGARRVTFLGGEPTLHKGFHDAVAHAVALGFEEIVIFTNGVMFPHPGFIERVVALGPRLEWRVSIQGADEQSHVGVTGRADSFARILGGLRRLASLGQRVTVNACLTEKNYRSLSGYPALVAEHGIAQLHVDIVRPSSTGRRDEAALREMMPPYSVLAPHLREMLETFEAEHPGFDVNVGNLPYCVLPEWHERIHHGGEETVTQACDAEGFEAPIDKYEWHASMRRHPAACGGCVFRGRCSGVFGEYLALRGEAEFRAVSEADLRAAERVRLARRRVLALARGLRAMEGLGGWTFGELRRAPDEASLPLRSPSGEILEIVFLQGTGEGAPLVTVDFRLEGDATPERARPLVARVVEWLSQRARVMPVS